MAKKTRWELEGEQLLDALGGPKVNPLNKPAPAPVDADDVQDEKSHALAVKRARKGGRPLLGQEISDPSVPYSFRIKKSKLETIKKISLENTMLISEMLEEAIDALIEKYQKK